MQQYSCREIRATISMRWKCQRASFGLIRKWWLSYIMPFLNIERADPLYVLNFMLPSPPHPQSQINKTHRKSVKLAHTQMTPWGNICNPAWTESCSGFNPDWWYWTGSPASLWEYPAMNADIFDACLVSQSQLSAQKIGLKPNISFHWYIKFWNTTHQNYDLMRWFIMLTKHHQWKQ